MAPEARGAPFSRHFASLLGAAAFFLLAASPIAPTASASTLSAWTEGPQPNFSLPALDGAEIALDTQRANVVLVHFFATWCAPCREELPALMRLAQRGGASVKVLAISVAEVDLRVQRFLAPLPVNFPVLLDRDRAVAKAWKVSALPTTFVLDGQLRPRLVVEADYAWDTIDPKQLITALSEEHGHVRVDQQSNLIEKQQQDIFAQTTGRPQ
jgi:thiol-disulfide isomerase/thioredoxin